MPTSGLSTTPAACPARPPPAHCSVARGPCDEAGNFLPAGAQPPPRRPASPYDDVIQFRLAGLLFRKVEMSTTNIDEMLELWALDKMKYNDLGPLLAMNI
ncbi:hypothetical protein GGX14DRAFT_580764 [Mycena pura]|uniref:Uncharacterized protein n=1 Tax=Mycena pura TaxID=153505 RepID=A0AAD6UPC0_9AGAR|nr:hypothetical protein GGX14DRAFT_580764 [Mycena pura]